MPMTEGRLTRLSAEEARRRLAPGMPERYAELSVFQMALKDPPVAEAMAGLLGALLDRGCLDARLRELAIMRIGWSTGSVYEWTQHWRVATALGMEPADILGVRDWSTHDGYGPIERAVLQATDDTVQTGVIAEPTWRALRELFTDDAQLFELVIAINHWRLYSSVLRTLEVPLEDGVAPWPPDGRTPGPTARS
jgi:alkylhydroperoxidase family enzyme